MDVQCGFAAALNPHPPRFRHSTDAVPPAINRFNSCLQVLVVTEEILINVTPRETRVALVENGMLQEVHIERASRRGYVGNVYKGKVQILRSGLPPKTTAICGAAALIWEEYAG